MELSSYRGPLTLQDLKYLFKFRQLDLITKVKKLSDLQIRHGVSFDYKNIEVDGFKNLSSKTFTNQQLDLLRKGPNYAPKRGISKYERTVIEARVDSALSRLPVGTVEKNNIEAF